MKSLLYSLLFTNYSTIYNLLISFFISLLVIFMIKIFKIYSEKYYTVLLNNSFLTINLIFQVKISYFAH